ncbi:MAG TPA: hypothetical protein VE422_30635 [Terriglobia bacterium]|nr:hypothetical protein [Terriglobia bacterium]
MMPSGAIQALSEFLQSAEVKLRVRAERLVPSAIYDLQYRMFVTAAAFEIHAKPLTPFGSRIHATRLKLLQFVAIRPWLLPVIEEWSSSPDNEQGAFDAQELRRGFLGDKTHDHVVAFLVARGAFDWSGSHLLAGKRSDILTDLSAFARENELFNSEREILTALIKVRITNRMLEGS